MEKILDKIIEELLKDKRDPVIQLGEYFLTGDPIYLGNAKKYDNKIDQSELMEYLAQKVINDYRTKKENL